MAEHKNLVIIGVIVVGLFFLFKEKPCEGLNCDQVQPDSTPSLFP